MYISSVIVLLLNILHLDALPSLRGDNYSININMPDVRPEVPDSYLCTAKMLNPAESYIVQFEPDASGRTAHHMLLFGCKSLHSQSHLYPGYWNCGTGDVCSTMAVMYGWAKNAPSIVLPPDVGFLTGGNSSIQYLVLQIHYSNSLPDGFTDNSGLKLYMTTQRQPYITGIHLLFADSAEISPYQEKYHVDVNCKFEGKVPIHPFAYRVHTHKLGTVVTGYKFSMQNNNWTFLSKGNPQWPQAFYPMNHLHTITNNDILAARCTYNSTRMNHSVHIGSSSSDEMCNLYIMYYTEYRNLYQIQSTPCVGVKFWSLVENLPPGNDVPLPPNPELEQQAHSIQGHTSNSPIHYNKFLNEGHHATTIKKKIIPNVYSSQHQNKNFDQGSSTASQYKEADLYKSGYVKPSFNDDFIYKEVTDWPSESLKFGQIAAVTVDNKGNVVIFHRGNHVWNYLTFDLANNYRLTVEGPISKPTVIVLDSVTGQILSQWGRNLFFMPHGLFISELGDFWLTDVALHQVFKFSSSGSTQPLLILGERFVPGRDHSHFCKPASVAVSSNGDIYVADGYCNSRIIRFSSEGKYLSQWGKETDHFSEQNPPPNSFNIPHKVVLIEKKNLVCVADRENGRIQCFTMVTGYFRFQIRREEFDGSLYSISYSNDHLYAVCGEATYHDHLVKAYVFNITDQKLLNVISPNSGTFTRPHDIAVSKDCNELYVCEIGPNKVWKFNRDYHKSSKKVLIDVPDLSSVTTVSSVISNEMNPTIITSRLKSHANNQTTQGILDDVNNFETSLIIMALLAIPVLMLIVVTTVVRLRKRGKLQHCSFGHLKGWLGGYRTPHPQDRFNIGNLLNPHKGFDRVAVEESDGEGENGSDSDVEEFSAISNKA